MLGTRCLVFVPQCEGLPLAGGGTFPGVAKTLNWRTPRERAGQRKNTVSLHSLW